MGKKASELLNENLRSSRKKERMLHNLLVIGLWLVVLLPLILCMVLFGRVAQLEKELDEVKEINAEASPGSFEAELKEMALAAEVEDEEITSGKETTEKQETGEEEGVQVEDDQVQNASTSAIHADHSVTGDGTGNDGRKHVYLTFDDGPSDHTGELLELLEDNGMTATFFCIGKTDTYSTEMYQRIVEGGHTLAMHSYSHDYESLYASLDSFKEDFYKIQSYMEEITGEKPIYYRFPGGSSNTVSKVNMKQCIRFLNSEGINYYDWNALNGDAEGKVYSVQEMLKRTMSGIKLYDNPVVLMHDTNAKQRTMEMMPKLIKKLKKMGAVVEGINENTPLVQHVKASSVNE